MKKFLTFIFLINFSLVTILLQAPVVSAGAITVNNSNAITILPGTASSKFQAELDKIDGLEAKNARLTFSPDKGVEGYASPVNVDMLKAADFTKNTMPFVGTELGTLNISGGVYARDGKIVFTRGTVTPATLNIFHIENAIENVLNSYIGTNYIGSVDVYNNMILAHITDDPNPLITPTTTTKNKSISEIFKAGIVPDCNKTGATSPDPYVTGATQYTTPCGLEMLGVLVNRVINFLLVYFATPLAALIIAYAGFLLIFSSANEHNKTKAKGIIGKVIVGYIIALAAWLIINTILSTFLTNDAMTWSFLAK